MIEKKLHKTGTTALEIVALDLKTQGSYLARSLSFKGASVHAHLASTPPTAHALILQVQT